MRTLREQVGHFLRKSSTRKNLAILARLLLVLAVIVAVYSLLFHLLMLREGRQFSGFSGIYWTLTVMSTLGFGDITFESDLGRAFSMFVLLTGTVYMLILLPFSFIRFFYAPWMEAQSEVRALRRVPPEMSGHVLLTHYDEVSATLIHKLQQYRYPYFLLVPNLGEALRLHDSGFKVVQGDLDNPEVYRNLQVERAAMVATTASDPVNTHVAFTVRALAADVPIIATADDPASVDILELAGCSFVLEIPEMLGQSLARRTHGGDARAQAIGRYGELIIAETTVSGTPMVGRTLLDIGLRRDLGISVVGVWDRGEFETARPETTVTATSVLVLAGTEETLDRYNERYRDYGASDAPIVIIGGGRVGRATARALTERGLTYRIVEQNPELASESEACIVGNAAELSILEKAGIGRAR
jgi:Trk K+ transport system NAD-binding subunit